MYWIELMRISTRFRRPIAVAVVFAFCLWAVKPQPLQAAEPTTALNKKAVDLAARAEGLHAKRKFGDAARLWLSAWQADPAGTQWVYNAARSFEEGEMFEEAAKYYATFLAEPGGHVELTEKAMGHAADVERMRTDNGRFIMDSTGETAKDRNSGLTWERGPEAPFLQWQAAKAHCDHKPAVSGTWRLPTRDDLLDLAHSAIRPGIQSHVFPNAARGRHWSSTREFSEVSTAWAVNFDDGTSTRADKAAALHTRCVLARPTRAVEKTDLEPVVGSDGAMPPKRAAPTPAPDDSERAEARELEREAALAAKSRAASDRERRRARDAELQIVAQKDREAEERREHAEMTKILEDKWTWENFATVALAPGRYGAGVRTVFQPIGAKRIWFFGADLLGISSSPHDSDGVRHVNANMEFAAITGLQLWTGHAAFFVDGRAAWSSQFNGDLACQGHDVTDNSGSTPTTTRKYNCLSAPTARSSGASFGVDAGVKLYLGDSQFAVFGLVGASTKTSVFGSIGLGGGMAPIDLSGPNQTLGSTFWPDVIILSVAALIVPIAYRTGTP